MKFRHNVRLYAAGTVATAFFIGATITGIHAMQQTTSWEQVYTNGTFAGLVPNNENIRGSMERTANAFDVALNFAPVHTVVATNYKWKAVESIPTSAISITLNNRPLTYVANQSEASLVLETVEKSLLPKRVNPNAKIDYLGQVDFKPVIVGVSNILSSDSAIRYLLYPHTTMSSGRGENVAFRALPAYQVPATPLLDVSVEEMETQRSAIPFHIRFVDDNKLGVGNVSLIQHGRPGVVKEQIKLQYVNGRLIKQTVVHSVTISAPIVEIEKRGTNSGVASGQWIWPTPNYTITSPFGWRYLFGGQQFHPGVDIGDVTGTPIYATNNGYVEDAGWNSGGYGNWVKISNGNGIESVFGHMSHVIAKAGELVSKGTLIGYSGATGDATGPHLHYEVRINGTAVNPAPYM